MLPVKMENYRNPKDWEKKCAQECRRNLAISDLEIERHKCKFFASGKKKKKKRERLGGKGRRQKPEE